MSRSNALKLLLAAPALVLAAALLSRQPHTSAQTPPVNGMRPADPRAHAIVDATVITAPGQKVEHASILIRNGLIEAVGPADQIKVPAEARVWPATGMIVYPGLIDPALLIKPGDAPKSAGAHWNPRVHPELAMADQPAPDKALRKELRGMGFAAAAVYPSAGAFRGSGVVLALADEDEHALAYRRRAAMGMAFEYGGFGGRGPAERPDRPERPEPAPSEPSRSYPSSLMGAIALLRQTLHDAQWHAQCRQVWEAHPGSNEPPIRADALIALNDVINGRQRVLFEVSDELNALRAAKLAREFKLDMMLLGSGVEFRRLNEVIAAGLPIIIPLEFPKRPDVSTLATADSVSLRDMMTWEQAPTNPRRLVNAAKPDSIALTTHKLKSRGDFHANLRSAIKHGLTEDQALAAMTTTPAKLLGLEEELGTIAPGKAANLVVVKGSLFDKEGKVYDTWVNGRRYEVFKDPDVQLKGEGRLRLSAGPELDLPIEIDTVKSSVTITMPAEGENEKDTKVSAKKVIVQQDQLSFVTDGRPFGVEGYVRLSGVMEGTPPTSVSGSVALPDGASLPFAITVTPESTEAGADDANKKEHDPAAQAQPDKKPEAPAAEEEPAEVEKKPDPVTGLWTIRSEQMPQDMSVTFNLRLIEPHSVSGTVNVMGQSIDFTGGSFEPSSGKVMFSFAGPQGPADIEGNITADAITGRVTSPNFTGDFAGSREGGSRAGGRRGKGKKDEEAPFIPPPEELVSPLGEYGLAEPPKLRNVLLFNATIWTCGPQGIIEKGAMLVRDGKIAFIGDAEDEEKLHAASARMPHDYEAINLEGRHITPGLIDCHSHTGISGGVNEGTQANSAECRIGDCIDPDDIDWYRELAGGLTAANQLHGSANPIGGQNSVVKLKWGGTADDFSIDDAIPGIKFALGENVKRSNGRYPNTRMGVETFIRDAFTAAKEYKARWDRYEALPSEKRAATMPPRRDLELEALYEILDHKRLVHCHSYRQDEILMLIRVADAFGFTIGTFQHVLEGYKVAEAIAKHGAGASSFSDWWAYKMEVIDAIPHNGALMNKVGVLVSFNSDSDELARRMNTEAAKAVRYGGMPPHEALKFVTINPARQLRIDKRTGSLEQGKDADFAVWSGDPLSTYTRCEQTWIEGARYFDLETDKQLRETIQSERQRLIQKILIQTHGELPKPGAETQPATGPDTQPQTSPGTQPEALRIHLTAKHRAWLEEQARLGRDPDEIRPGECGCGDHLHE